MDNLYGNNGKKAAEAASEKEKQLEVLLGRFEKVMVAFSGGADSTYLLGKAAQVLGRNRVQAVTFQSALNPYREVEEAAGFALKLKVKHRTLNLDILKNQDFAANTPQRCYICKQYIFSRLVELAKQEGFDTVLDGSNADDAEDYRPGMRAAEELGIRSPLLEVSLGKDEIRRLSRLKGYPGWDKPSAACLASRMPYGEEITAEKLKRISDAERILRRAGVKGNLRVRSHGNLARIEADSNDLDGIMKQKGDIAARLKALGYNYVTLDLFGFESGSMNR